MRQVAGKTARHGSQSPVCAVEDGGRRTDDDAIGAETGERTCGSGGVGDGGSCGSEYLTVTDEERKPKQQTKDDEQEDAANHVTKEMDQEWNQWLSGSPARETVCMEI